MTTVVDDDLDQIVRAIWDALFEFPLDSGHAPTLDQDPSVTSVVQIDGAWQGAVVLRCSMALATLVTAAMFQAGVEPGADDVRDALGELANMVAGNVKALLPEPCGISLPAVALGVDYKLQVVGTVPIAGSVFSSKGFPLVVTLLHRSGDESR